MKTNHKLRLQAVMLVLCMVSMLLFPGNREDISAKGIDFLIDCYAAEHTLSIEDAVEDIMLLCQKNGGRLGC